MHFRRVMRVTSGEEAAVRARPGSSVLRPTGHGCGAVAQRSARVRRQPDGESEQPPQPGVDRRVVVISQTTAGVDPVEQGVRWMVSGDPGPIGVGDLVVDPDERASRRPCDKGAGLPVQSVPLVLIIDVGRFRPGHHGQLWQTNARGDAFVRVSHPCRGPDHLARERRQPRPVPGIEPGQERIRIGVERFEAGGMGRILLGRRTERDERSVDIEKQQRTLRRASHAGTIAADRNGDRTVSTTSALRPTAEQSRRSARVRRSSVRGKQARDQVSQSSSTPHRGYVACGAGRRVTVMPRPHGVPHESGNEMAFPRIRTVEQHRQRKRLAGKQILTAARNSPARSSTWASRQTHRARSCGTTGS